ncbi:MAG: hypothetical protein EXR39_18755 [Betaproteobacteria bacterium]|nr:hypothetical protein [Betaproteobacteria bacterium]
MLLGVSLLGCSGTPVKLAGVTKTDSIDRTKGRQISSSASDFQLLLLIPININSRHERAFQDLQRQTGGDQMADIKITESWAYAFVGTMHTTTIEATAYPKAP